MSEETKEIKQEEISALQEALEKRRPGRKSISLAGREPRQIL